MGYPFSPPLRAGECARLLLRGREERTAQLFGRGRGPFLWFPRLCAWFSSSFLSGPGGKKTSPIPSGRTWLPGRAPFPPKLQRLNFFHIPFRSRLLLLPPSSGLESDISLGKKDGLVVGHLLFRTGFSRPLSPLVRGPSSDERPTTLPFPPFRPVRTPSLLPPDS